MNDYAYWQGRDAYFVNGSCPYEDESEEWYDWVLGYEASERWDTEEAYEEGRRAAYDATNPYLLGTPKYKQWEVGWRISKTLSKSLLSRRIIL